MDVAKAVRQSLFADPASVSLGELKWPQSPNDVRDRSVTLRNTTATPLSLTLKLTEATPGGVFSVPSTVDVPANGTAEVTVRAASPASAPAGNHTAMLVAQTAAGTVSARIPVGLVREPENHEHTITVLDRAGKPSTGTLTLAPVPLSSGQMIDLPIAGQPGKIRLPRGKWTVLAWFRSDADDPNAPMVLAALPDVDSRDHKTITFDGRRAKPVTIAAPDGAARVVSASFGIRVGGAGGFTSASFDSPDGPTVTEAGGGFVIPTTGSGRAREFEFRGHAVFAKPTGEGFDGASEVYRVTYGQQGAIPTRLDYRPTRAQFATVTSSYARGDKDGPVTEGFPTWSSVDQEGGQVPITIPASGTRTTHLAAGGDPIRWWAFINNENGESYQADRPRTYKPGRRYEQRWNRPMHTVALPAWAWEHKRFVRRSRDLITVEQLPMYSGSSDGHIGYLENKSEVVELYENGTKIGEQPTAFLAPFPVGYEPASYRLVVRSTPAVPEVPDASSTLEWTFTSSTTPSRSRQPLPVSVAHYTPRLNADGRAPANARFRLPIQIQGAPGAVTRVTVDASYDGGKTWTPSEVTGGGKAWTATLQHPAKTDTVVSLRSHLVRADGGTTTHTQLGAYQLQ